MTEIHEPRGGNGRDGPGGHGGSRGESLASRSMLRGGEKQANDVAPLATDREEHTFSSIQSRARMKAGVDTIGAQMLSTSCRGRSPSCTTAFFLHIRNATGGELHPRENTRSL